jgi:hypothetical protein
MALFADTKLILHVLKNHLTTSFCRSYLADQHKFLFVDEKTGNQLNPGLILMRKMLYLSKPETIVKVC